MSDKSTSSGVTGCNQKRPKPNDNRCNGYALQSKIENLKEDEVKALYLKMRAEGITPTARLLRSELKHGSFTTLQKMISNLNQIYAQNDISEIKNRRIPDGVMSLLIEELSKRALKCTIDADDKKISELEQMVLKLTRDHAKSDEDFACELDASLKRQSELEMALREKEKINSKLLEENTELKNQVETLSSQLEINREKYKSLDDFSNVLKAIRKDPGILDVFKGNMEV